MDKVFFYSAIKPFDHHTPSGDRLIAQNLIKALQLANYEVSVPSRMISYIKQPDGRLLRERRQQAVAEIERIISAHKNDKPKAFITYHPYCKAPDWIGPAISEYFNIPYITVEACKTGQLGFEEHRQDAQKGLLSASAHIYFKQQDREYLESLSIDKDHMYHLPPFLDDLTPPTVTMPTPLDWPKEDPILVTVGMMRAGKKSENYKILAQTLLKIVDLPWRLVIIGDGQEQQQVRTAFNKIPKEKILWTGALPSSDVLSWMKQADAFVWPGWQEPIGMVYLEAASMGLPCIAFKSMGVPLVVEDKVTGLLSEEGSIELYAKNITEILTNKSLRQHLSKNCIEKVKKMHSMSAASHLLELYLETIIDKHKSD